MTNFYTDADLSGSGEFAEATVTLATEFTLPAGVIASVRSRFPAVAGATVAMRIYNSSGTSLASASAFDTTTVDAWNTATISGGLTVSAGTYRVCIVVTRYIAKGGFFSGGSVTRSGMTAVQGRFDSGDVAPASTSTATYFVDIDFTSSSGGQVTFSTTPTLSATATRVQPATASFSTTPALTASATLAQAASVSFTTTPALTATATRVQPATATFATTPTLSASAGSVIAASATFSATPTLSASATLAQPAAVTFATTPALTASATRVQPAAVAFTTTPALTAAATLLQAAAVSFTATPALSLAALVQRLAAVLFATTPALLASGSTGPVVPYATATLTPGALDGTTLTPGAAGPTLVPGALATATLTPGNL